MNSGTVTGVVCLIAIAAIFVWFAIASGLWIFLLPLALVMAFYKLID